ncbi:MAG: hypothetical protein K9I36_16745 [Bacteroidia bacterium]|nr:hypothetical protein [Bacteroidia bacterium]
MSTKINLNQVIVDFQGEPVKADVKYAYDQDGKTILRDTTGEEKIISYQNLTLRHLLIQALNKGEKEMDFAGRQRYGRLIIPLSKKVGKNYSVHSIAIKESEVRDNIKRWSSSLFSNHVCAQIEQYLEGKEFETSKNSDFDFFEEPLES